MTFLKDLDITWKALTVIGVIFMTGVSGGAWSVAWAIDLRTQVAMNTTARNIQTFDTYTAIRKVRRLTVVEWQRWCSAGRALGAFPRGCPAR